MVVGRIERYLVGIIALVVAGVIALQVGMFVRGEFMKVTEAFAKIGAARAVR